MITVAGALITIMRYADYLTKETTEIHDSHDLATITGFPAEKGTFVELRKPFHINVPEVGIEPTRN